jgi:asparagine synthase (glutamine-hydrolysing)
MVEHDLALIHTRYSIIDLTEAAHQPFLSRDGSIVGIFNGEIYNYIELKAELSTQGVVFRTTSDTEVLIEGYRIWGNDLWSKMNGFWAVALYDFKNGNVILSRDRIGVAPLYYRELEHGFFFASTIQPLIDIQPHDLDINDDVVLGFAQTGIKDHDNSTFYQQINSLPSCTTVIVSAEQSRFSDSASHEYWHFPSSRLSNADISLPEATERFRQTFFNAVELRLRADVPVAFELSGGLDSSSIVAAAAVIRNSDIITYTARVEGADEEPYARAILKKYPVDYRVIDRIEKNFQRDCHSFSRIMEEPYDNPNAYTHHKMLWTMKDEGMSVVVTGAGGDEILGGYESSFWPKAYSELKSNGLYWHADWYEFCRRFKTIQNAWQTLRHYIVDFPAYLRNRFLPVGPSEKNLRQTRALTLQQQYGHLSFHEQALYHFRVALIPFYMRSSDHFTMTIPIEHRFPLLDYRLVELCLQMPITYLFKGGWTKYLLRKAMEPFLPGKILWRRKKMGFTFPYRQYFSINRSSFEPLLGCLELVDLPWQEFGNYHQLLRENPVLLWRILSIALWIKNTHQTPVFHENSLHS